MNGAVEENIFTEGTSAALNDRLKAGDMAGMAALITDDMLEHFAVEASWGDLADALKAKYDGIADRLVLYFAEEMHQTDPELLRRMGEVAASLR